MFRRLVIPVLSGSSRDDDGGGLLSRFTRGRSRDDATTDGCDPEVFAAQIREYLDRAAEERQQQALLREDAEALRSGGRRQRGTRRQNAGGSGIQGSRTRSIVAGAVLGQPVCRPGRPPAVRLTSKSKR